MGVVLYLGRIKAVYQLYWGQDQLYRLLYEDLGLSDALSSFIATPGSFLLAMAWIPLSAWVWRLAAWRFTFRQAGTAFGCWVLIYGTTPLAHFLFGSDVCFNQRTGQPVKWYAQDPTELSRCSTVAGMTPHEPLKSCLCLRKYVRHLHDKK